MSADRDSFAREAARRANLAASEAKSRSERALKSSAANQKALRELHERLEAIEAKTREIRELGKCVFCGLPTTEGLACRAHRDLFGHD